MNYARKESNYSTSDDKVQRHFVKFFSYVVYTKRLLLLNVNTVHINSKLRLKTFFYIKVVTLS